MLTLLIRFEFREGLWFASIPEWDIKQSIGSVTRDHARDHIEATAYRCAAEKAAVGLMRDYSGLEFLTDFT